MTLEQRCAQSLKRGWQIKHPPLCDARAEMLRAAARNGEFRPAGLSGLEMMAWIMGAAEAAAERNAEKDHAA